MESGDVKRRPNPWPPREKPALSPGPSAYDPSHDVQQFEEARNRRKSRCCSLGHVSRRQPYVYHSCPTVRTSILIVAIYDYRHRPHGLHQIRSTRTETWLGSGSRQDVLSAIYFASHLLQISAGVQSAAGSGRTACSFTQPACCRWQSPDA